MFFILMLCFGCSSRGADDPKIDAVGVDNNDRRIVLVHFADPVPNITEVQRADYWIVYSKASDKVNRHTVVGVDTSRFTGQSEHTIILQLTQDLPEDWDDLDVSLVNDTTILHVDPDLVVKPKSGGSGQETSPLESATGRDDSDIYFSGSYTGVVDGDPVWDIDAFAGYMKAIQTDSHYWGKLGFFGQIKTNSSATADPDSFLTYGVYQRVLGKAWLGPFQAPYLNYRFAGWEFDREGKELNFVTSPVMTIPFRLSGKLAGPIEPGVTFPHMTLQLGTEFVDVWNTPLAEDPTTGKKGDTPPKLGTQARHTVDTTMTYMFLKWAGLSFEHTYGSLPPAFNFTGHSFKVGLTFTLKQTSSGRYSILKP